MDKTEFGQPIIAAILAGGKGLRMRTDKANVEFDGMTLLHRVVSAVSDAGLSVLVVGRCMPDKWPMANVAFFPDDFEQRGPLGGLATALRFADGKPVIALSCDLPLLTVQAIRWLQSQFLNSADDYDGIATKTGSQIQPLFAIYRASTLPIILERLDSGRNSLIGVVERCRFLVIDCPLWVASSIVDVNTPEELRSLEGRSDILSQTPPGNFPTANSLKADAR